jgi:acyl-CoA thioesterase FadM
MVATLACAPATFTGSAPRARGRAPASRSRAARPGAPTRSAEARATAESTVSETSVESAAHETPCRVYIEHTDAYQVVYHANYFKFLARGREEALFGARGGEIVAALTSEGSKGGGTSSDGDATPFLVAAPTTRARAARFASPATLGDDLIVTSAVIEVDANEKTVVFEQTVLDAATRETRFAATTTVVALFSSFADGDDGGETRAFGTDHPTWLALNAAEKRSVPLGTERGGATPSHANESAGRETFATKITLHREELGRGEFGFCEADVLRFFERNRTDAIGGSAALARLKDERGIIVVVSGMEDIAFAPGGMRALVAGETRARTKKAPPRLRTVFSRSATEVKRRGLQIAFAHELVAAPTEGPDADAWSSEAVVLARAEVTCTCLSAETGRPVRCPEELAARFATT